MTQATVHIDGAAASGQEWWKGYHSKAQGINAVGEARRTVKLLDRMVQAVSGKQPWPPALQRLSEDQVALAKVMVMFRVVLADGVVRPTQLAAFTQLCAQRFGIEPRDIQQLHALLESPVGRDSEAEASALIRQLDSAARTALLDDMIHIARANSEPDAGEDKLIRRTADLLGLEPGSAPGRRFR